MNPSVGRPIIIVGSSDRWRSSRPGARRRACHGEGNCDGQRWVPAFSQKFDEGVKKIFSTLNSRADQHVKFGSPRDNDLDYGIKVGRITLTG